MDNRMSLLTSPFVPEGMVDLMKKLSKGVIKEKPSNIHEYAAAFFEKMLIERDGSLDKGYGKFRSYTEYCKFMDKMDQRRLSQTTKKDETTTIADTTDTSQEEVIPLANIEVQGVAIQGVERKSKDSVKNVSINPKYKTQSEKVSKPVASNAKNVKAKPRKLSSKKPSESLIVIKEETSADVDDSGNGESNLHRAAETIQKAFRMYLSQKTNRGENITEASGSVSQLSENAAAIIIQKAFKSLIQKSKYLEPKSGKIGEESNNNVVVPVAGQENDIIIDKSISNNDENSEQILIETEQVDTEKYSENKDNQLEASEDTTDLSETQLSTNLEVVTASNTTTQKVESEEIKEFTENDLNAGHNQAASDNIEQSRVDQDVVSPQENIESTPLDESTSLETKTNEVQETLPDRASSVELRQHDSAGDRLDHPTDPHIESVENVTADSRSELIECNENELKNIADVASATVVLDDTFSQPLTDTKEDELSIETTDELEKESKLNEMTTVVDDESSQQVSETTQTTAVLNVQETDQPIATDSAENNVQPEIIDNLIQMDSHNDSDETKIGSTLISENAPVLEVDNENNVKDKEDLSADIVDKKQIDDTEELQSKDQLFLVENDGIYVNMDVFQDKFGAIAVDDGTGIDGEKSFKLNILEREEILVNQENVQPIEGLAASDNVLDKNNESSNIAEIKRNEIDEEMESMENDIKDEEGNEEYELAETVVLGDPPLIPKSYQESEHSPMTTDGDDESSDKIKIDVSTENQEQIVGSETLKCDANEVATQNESNDEFGKLEPNAVDDNSLEKPSESIKIADSVSDDDHTKGELIQKKTDSEEILKEQTVVEQVEFQLKNYDDQLNKEHLVPNLEQVSKHEIIQDQLKQTAETQTNSNSEEVFKEKTVTEELETKNENIGDQLSKEHLVPNLEQVSKKESDEVESQLEKYNDQLNKEYPVPNLEQVSKHEIIQEQLNQTNSNSEKVLKEKTVTEESETKNENIGDQLNQSDELSKAGNDEVDTKCELVGEQAKTDSDATLNDQTTESEGTTELVTITKNQQNETDKEEKIECESESKMNDEMGEAKDETEFQVTDEAQKNIDLSKNDDTIIDTENDEESSGKLLKIKENEELVKAATIIQKVFRGYVVRNVQSNRSKDQLELSAALIIQKYVRGYLVRRNMQKPNNFSIVQVTSNEIKDEENETSTTDDQPNVEVAPQMPAYSNRFLIPKDSFLERESFADDEDYTRTCKELAATSIQKTYRGYRVRRSLKASGESDDVENDLEGEMESTGGNDQVQTVVSEAERVISAVLSVATDVIPAETYDSDSFEDEAAEDKHVRSEAAQEKTSNDTKGLNEPPLEPESVLGQAVQDNIHVEGQMQQKYNQMTFQGNTINPIEEMSESFENPETPVTTTLESMDSKNEGSKSFSYEQLSSDLSDTEENKRESLKESEVDETSRDERDDLSEVENFDLSSCGEDSLEAMYYSIRKNEILLDKMQKQVTEPISGEFDASENLKVEFPERVTENLDVAMQQVFQSLESSSDCDGGKNNEDDNSSTLDLGLDDSSSINDEKEIETSRHIKQSEEINLEDNEQLTVDIPAKENEDVSESSESNINRDAEAISPEQSQQSDSSFNSSTRFIMKSQSVSEDMMNPIVFAMKRKQALLDQLHVRPYLLEENLSEDHDAFPEHLLSDIDIGNIQRKIFASSVSETDSDYIEPNVTNRRLVRDDFNISTALDHLSTDSDSTIVSAATKIQAGARGFLTRRRLRRSSAGGTSISFEKRYSFGNAAIDKSLEDLIKRQEQINLDGAALKIQQQYRRYQARKNNLKKVSPIREQTLELSGGSSVEGTDDNMGITEITLAQKKGDSNQRNVDSHPIMLNIDEVDTVQPVKRTPVNQRRLTLQRGDAVQRNSRPDSQDSNIKDGNRSSSDNQSNDKFKDSETGEYTGTINNKPEKKVTAYINIQSLINRGIGPRQRSMPVQIDSELMRIIPKHLRKRVKSADNAKKRSN